MLVRKPRGSGYKGDLGRQEDVIRMYRREIRCEGEELDYTRSRYGPILGFW
jgi:hypothetical protein